MASTFTTYRMGFDTVFSAKQIFHTSFVAAFSLQFLRNLCLKVHIYFCKTWNFFWNWVWNINRPQTNWKKVNRKWVLLLPTKNRGQPDRSCCPVLIHYFPILSWSNLTELYFWKNVIDLAKTYRHFWPVNQFLHVLKKKNHLSWKTDGKTGEKRFDRMALPSDVIH